MHRIPFILFLLIFLPQWMAAQYPGGVDRPARWYVSGRTAPDQHRWIDGLQTPLQDLPEQNIRATDTKPQLNFYPAFSFPAEAPAIQLPLPPLPGQSFDLFTLFQPENEAGEGLVWSLETTEAVQQLMTTHRYADLMTYRYINFPAGEAGKVELNRFFQAGALGQAEAPQYIRWSGSPKGKTLPVEPFEGLLPEWIFYDRVLRPQEAARVETYLAIKYGITLRRPKPADYIDSRGRIIWSATANAAYHHRVAGIGRDDDSALRQWQSTSSEAPGQLTIGFTGDVDSLADGSFLVWGDDDRPAQWGQKQAARPQRLQRTWKVQITGQAGQQPTRVAFDPKGLFDRPGAGERYWLLIEYGGQAKFEVGQTDLVPAAFREGMISAEGIRWEKQGNEHAYFTFAKGPALLALTTVDAPSCISGGGGSLRLQIAGGTPPYAVRLEDDRGKSLSAQAEQANEIVTLDDLAPGSYHLTISDGSGATYRESIFVGTKEGPAIPLADHYQLPATGELWLDGRPPDATSDRRYAWAGPDGFSSNDPRIAVRKPGRYQLTVTDGACMQRQVLLVEQASNQLFERVECFPNPVMAGRPFELQAELKTARPLEIRIFDALGKNIYTGRRPAGQFHHFRKALSNPGLYLLQLKTGDSTRTLRIIVQS